MESFSPDKSSRSLAGLAGLALITTVLGGCGGGGGSDPVLSSGGAKPAPSVQSGVLSDSAVAGVAYSTSPSGKNGTTNSNGEYEYMAGDTVTFTVAGLVLPAVTATGRVTPQTIAEEVFAGNVGNAALNLAILFQGLDRDGDPSNGIEVDPGTTLSANISLASLEDDSPQVFSATLAGEALPPGAVVPDPAQALEHFYRTELAGNWRRTGGNRFDDMFVLIDGSGHLLWVEYNTEGSPATCSVFDSGYSAIYTGSVAIDEVNLVATMESNERDLGTDCAPGSTDHVADMFGGEITLEGNQLVIAHPVQGHKAYFERFNNVKHTPIGVWQDDAVRGDDGSLDFGADINGQFSIFTDEVWIAVVLGRAPGGESCEYNGVYVATGYGFNEVSDSSDEDDFWHEIRLDNPMINHVWKDPYLCEKNLPVGSGTQVIGGSRANDSIWLFDENWVFDVAPVMMARNLSAAERAGDFNSVVDEQALVGSWRMDDAADDDVDLHILNFLSDGKYVQGVIHKDLGDGDFCGHGLEYGDYSLIDRTLGFSVELDTIPDMGCGMTEHGAGSELDVARLDDDTLVMSVGRGWEQLSFTRISNDGFGGSWVGVESEFANDGAILSLLDDGYYLQLQHSDADGAEDSTTGVEYGRYTLSAEGELKVTQILADTNGTAGLSDSYPADTIALEIDGEGILRLNNSDGCFGLQRIEEAPGSLAVQGNCLGQ